MCRLFLEREEKEMNPFDRTVEIMAIELHQIIIEHGEEVEKRFNALLQKLEEDYNLPVEIRKIFGIECEKCKVVEFDDISDEGKEKFRKWALRLCNKYADYSP